MKLHKRPTRDGLWHPVEGNAVMWPVEVNIHPVMDPETGEPTRKRIVSTYTFGTEERRDLDDYKPATMWLRYSAPKVQR